MNIKDVLETQTFYELMQAYRHAEATDQPAVKAAFEDVKLFIQGAIATIEANASKGICGYCNQPYEGGPLCSHCGGQ